MQSLGFLPRKLAHLVRTHLACLPQPSARGQGTGVTPYERIQSSAEAPFASFGVSHRVPPHPVADQSCPRSGYCSVPLLDVVRHHVVPFRSLSSAEKEKLPIVRHTLRHNSQQRLVEERREEPFILGVRCKDYAYRHIDALRA